MKRGTVRTAGPIILSLWCLFPCAFAASTHTATFSSGAEGWTNSGSLQIAAASQALRGHFSAQGFPIPETGSLVATNTSSGGAFTGDYPDAGISLIGFSFMAEDVLPSTALLRWHGPTSSFFRSFAADVTTTGVWYQFAFSLRSKNAGSWVGGSSSQFDDSLLDVGWLEIQLTRSGMAVQRYYVDDVFVDGLPTGWVLSTTGGMQVLWSSLRTNVAYTVESADEPTTSWDEAGNFVAINETHIWSDVEATNNHRQVYRLRFNESQ